MNMIEQLEAEEVARVTAGKDIPKFSPGDTLSVNVKIKEGDRERVQRYEGVCIARAGAGINENFTVRKISFGEGVERIFPVVSPMIESIEVKRKGRVKLYYLRDRRGKSARIAERTTGHGMEVTEVTESKTELRRQRDAAKVVRKEEAAKERTAAAKAKAAEAAAAAKAAEAEGGEEA
jgi:large subunit ribosomal protein L19